LPETEKKWRLAMFVEKISGSEAEDERMLKSISLIVIMDLLTLESM
jgi:hypothetical protein